MLTLLFTSLQQKGLARGDHPADSFLSAFHGSFLIAGTGLLLFLLATLLRRQVWWSRAPADAAK